MRELAKEVHHVAKAHGWWADVDVLKSIPEKLCLIHSEVSEALEAYRIKDVSLCIRQGKPDGFPAELADVIIRVLDLPEALGIDIALVVDRKHEYNKSRPFRHGGKAC